MEIAWWSAVVGLLLLVMALSDSLLARLPLSTSMLYLAVGAAVSPLWLDWIQVAATSHARALERIAEVVLLLSLFGSGLKMSLGLGDGRWLLPLRLAVVSMLVTVALIAGAGVAWLGLPLGAAILLGGILAPTDPVLASDVQVAEPTDRDRLPRPPGRRTRAPDRSARGCRRAGSPRRAKARATPCPRRRRARP